MQEVWEKIPSTLGHYEASNFGNIRNAKARFGTLKGKILRPGRNSHGYWQVCIQWDTKRRTVEVHRLIAETFLGVCHEGNQVNHIDNDLNNNQSRNLEYVTRKEHDAKTKIWRHSLGKNMFNRPLLAC